MVLDEQQLIKNYLSDYFFKVQAKNPRFSLRSFAQKLGISNSALSEILRSKRKVSKAKALEFAKAIKLLEKHTKTLMDAFDKSGSLEQLKPVSNPLKEILLTSDQFHIMGDRKYFSVLALFRSPMNSVSAMSARLGLTETEVQNILEELAKIGVLEKKNGQYIEKERAVFRTSEDFPDELMRNRRLQNTEASAKAIREKADGERGYFATVSVDKSKLDEIGPIVEDFVKRLSMFLRKPSSEDIFEVNVDIFPWTKK
jgi:uncharacterized protein (TIGR02147 family)